jgi:putative hydrolase of the HAD superfamily
LKAVIFDFDGLVVDTETPAFRAWSEIYKEFGVELQLAEWVLCVGSGYGRFDPVKNLEKLTGISMNGNELIAKKESIKSAICLTQPLLPGIKNLIMEARSLNIPVAVASSSPRSWIDLHADRTGILPFVSVICTREDVKNIKPAPDLYELAAHRLRVAAEDCIVFEDSQNGITAARAAGMRAIAVPNQVTSESDFSAAHLVVKSAADCTLAEFIKMFWSSQRNG